MLRIVLLFSLVLVGCHSTTMTAKVEKDWPLVGHAVEPEIKTSIEIQFQPFEWYIGD